MGVEVEPDWAARDSRLGDGPAEPDESVSVRIAALGRLCPVQEAAPAVSAMERSTWRRSADA